MGNEKKVEVFELYYRNYLIMVKAVEELKRLVSLDKDKYVIVCKGVEDWVGGSLGFSVYEMLKKKELGDRVEVIKVDNNYQDSKIKEDYKDAYIISMGSDIGDTGQEGLIRIREGVVVGEGDVCVRVLFNADMYRMRWDCIRDRNIFLIKDMAEIVSRIVRDFTRHLKEDVMETL